MCNKIIKTCICFYFIGLLLPVFAWSASIQIHSVNPVSILSGDGTSNLALPSDVTAYKNHVYVVDGGNHRIMVFDLNGQYKFQFGSEGNAKGQLYYPLGIDHGVNGKIYVTDAGNKRIQVYSAKGKYLNGFEVKYKNKLMRPVDVLVDSSRKELYVSSSDNHRVMVFSFKGKLKRHWGGSGVGEGEFRYPATLAHMTDNRIAVVDVLNSRVQVFSKQGVYSVQFSEWGVLQGQVFRPKGIAVNHKGDMYISDSYLNVVQVFSETGNFLHVLGNQGKQLELRTPVGMTFDKHKRLYISEMRKNQVTVLDVD